MSLRTAVGPGLDPDLASPPRSGPGEAGSSARTTFRPDIQGLRAVAVLMVVAAHAGIPGVYGGFAGVDVFFVISGFLITGLLVKEAGTRGRISLAQFYARRARRILPAGTLVLLVTVAAGLPLLGDVRAEGVVEDSLWATFFALNWKLGLDGTDYFSAALPPSPLLHYWSLAVEEQFYLVWPALLAVAMLAFRRRTRGSGRPRGWAPSVTVGAAAILVVSLGWSITSTDSNASMAYFSTLTRAWELALGAIVALLVPRLESVPVLARAMLGWTGLAAVVASIVVLEPTTPFPGYAALLPVVGSALAIGGGVGQPPGGAGLILGLRPLRWIGDRSYSLYLWHWPWLVVGAAYVGVVEASLAVNAVLLALALVCAMLSYTFVEVPFHTGWPRVPNLRFLVLWPLSFVVLLAAAGLVQVRASGQGRADAPGPGAPSGFAANGALRAGDVAAAVAAASAAASDDDEIPGELAPAPRDARDDTWHAGGNCGLATTGETTSRPCVLGDQAGDRTMVVIGDSHARMWLPSLDRIGTKRGFVVHPLIKYGCTAADVVPWRADLGGAQTDCADWREWAFDQVGALRPDVVVMSARTPPTLTTEDGEEMDADDAVEAHAAGVASSIRRLREVTDRVIVFSDTPTADFDPVTCVDQPGHDLGDCASPMDEESQIANVGIQAAADEAGGEFVDLTNWFCADDLCPSVVAGMLVYFDPGHITQTYGLALAPYLERRLELARTRGAPPPGAR